MKLRQLLLIFVPALLVVGVGLYIQALDYHSLNPKDKPAETATFKIPVLPDDIVYGNPGAAHTIVAFEDFSCPACAEQDSALKKLLEQKPNSVRIVWKGLPVNTFPYPSETAQRYGFCAHQQGKFTEFKTAAFANKDNLSSATLTTLAQTIGLKQESLTTCLNSPATSLYIERVKQLAAQVGIQSVPTFFVNNRQVQPSPTPEAWATLLQI